MTAHSAQKSAAEATLARQFAAQEASAPSPRRAAAFARFAKRGLPTRRIEAWHYTDLRSAMADAAPLAPAPDRAAIEAARALLAGRKRLGAARLVLLDGRYVADLSDGLPASAAIVRDESSTADVDDPLVALNEAMSAKPPSAICASAPAILAKICLRVSAPPETRANALSSAFAASSQIRLSTCSPASSPTMTMCLAFAPSARINVVAAWRCAAGPAARKTSTNDAHASTPSVIEMRE